MRAAIATRVGAQHRGRQSSYRNPPTTGNIEFHHAGGYYRPYAPDNTRASIAAAIANGATWVDIDARSTLDGVTVLMHDPATGNVAASNVTVASTNYASLPQVYKPILWGSGWAAENVAKLHDILEEFGGQANFTVEAKVGTSQAATLASIILAHGLKDSVFINGPDTTYTSAIVAAGARAHQATGLTTTAEVDAAIAAGATRVGIGAAVSDSVRAYAMAAGLLVFHGVATRAEWAARNTNVTGYVVDSPLYANRTTRRSTDISDMITTGRRAPGTKVTTSVANWLDPGIMRLRNGANTTLILGDISGPLATTGKITWKYRYTTAPTDTTQGVRPKFLSTHEDTDSFNSTTSGYRPLQRYNGGLVLERASSPIGGTEVSLGTASSTALTLNSQIHNELEWSGTQVRFRRIDVAADTGWINDTTWRGDYQHIALTLSTGVCVMDGSLGDGVWITEP